MTELQHNNRHNYRHNFKKTREEGNNRYILSPAQ